MQSQISSSVLSAVVLISSYVSTASLSCNHAVLDDGYAVPAGVCHKEGSFSVMIECRGGEAHYVEWEFSDDCTGDNLWEGNLAYYGYEFVCDADPCQIAVVEDYHHESVGQDYYDYYGSSYDSNDYDYYWDYNYYNYYYRRRLQSSSSHDSDDSEDSDHHSSCDFQGTPGIFSFIVDECQNFGGHESIKISCTDTHDAVVQYFRDDDRHECEGPAAATTSARTVLGECATLVACNVEAGGDFELENYEPGTDYGDDEVSMASVDCNHAMIDAGKYVIVDVCYPDGGNSHMVQCRDGEAFARSWKNSVTCDGTHTFEQALPGEAVCDAEACNIAVFEVYDGGSTSGDASGSEDSSDSSYSWYHYYDDSSSRMFAGRHSSEWSSSGEGAFDVHGDSSDSSSWHVSCLSEDTPEIHALVIDTCLAVGGTESVIITCTGLHDATVSYFEGDGTHECLGPATATMDGTEFFAGDCSKMVACNAKAGDVYTYNGASVPNAAVAATFLVTLALLLNF